MEDSQSVASLMDSTSSRIQQLQKAFAELESHRAVTLNWKWKQIEEHFHGLEKSLKRRFIELEDQEKNFETKIVESKEMLARREKAIMSKEQASLDRLQEKRDAAVFAITSALGKHGRDDELSDSNGGLPIMENKPLDAMVSENEMKDLVKPSGNRNLVVKMYPELVTLCQKMDSEGLHKFISDNRKNLAVMKEEIPIALKAASNPASLVLDSLNGFYNAEVPVSDSKKDATLLGLRRTCIMLMECLSILLVDSEEDLIPMMISEDVKERAKYIAEDWKPMLDVLDVDASSGNSLEAHAFLQLLATFGINSDFDQESLSKLIPMVSRRRQTADLCRSLGLADKMPGVVDVLIRNGRQIDAVNLAVAFDLTEQFSPVSLLKSYLAEAMKASPPAAKQGNTSPSGQFDVSEKELSALKAVIKCIEEHKIEYLYPLEPLQKRVIQLEKMKAEKKRGTEVPKPLPKRPRANGAGGYAPRVANTSTDKNFYPRMTTDRYPQYIYDNRPFLATPAYSLSPGHGTFFGTGYQYQPAPYLH